MELYSLEMTKEENKMAKGVAVLAMLFLHLFCRLGKLPYQPLIYIGNTPLIYYFGLFGDICVPIFAFLSGYAHYRIYEINTDSYKGVLLRLRKFILEYWIVLLIVVFLGCLFDQTRQIPGSLRQFLDNFLLLDLNYCGAWWYIQIYILLNVFSKNLYKFIHEHSLAISIPLSLLVYCFAYYFRFMHPIHIELELLSKIISISVLFGTSVFPYLVGMLYRKYSVISLLRRKGKYTYQIFSVMVLVIFLFHCRVQTIFVAPFSGLVTITAFLLWDKPTSFKRIFLYLGNHSTNIWLIHMFFYQYIFTGFVFSAKYPLLIISLMLAVCLFASYVFIGIHYLISKVLKMGTSE